MPTGKVISSTLKHPWKAEYPTEVTPAGNSMEVNSSQSQSPLTPIVVKEAGSTSSVIAQCQKAFSPIVVISSDSVIVSRKEQP